MTEAHKDYTDYKDYTTEKASPSSISSEIELGLEASRLLIFPVKGARPFTNHVDIYVTKGRTKKLRARCSPNADGIYSSCSVWRGNTVPHFSSSKFHRLSAIGNRIGTQLENQY